MRTPYNSSAPIREKILKLHRQGKTVRQMSEILRLDKSTIMYHRHNLGLVQKQTAVLPRMVDDPVINTANRWLTRRWV